jgi:hypothetical protein
MNTRTASHPDRTQDREHRTQQPPTLDTRPLSVPPDRPARRIDLSVSQVVGGSLAAATAAALGSRLGVVGTITGAAVASLVASVASAVYTASLEHTRQRFSAALGTMRDGPARLGPQARRVLLGAAVVFALTAVAVTATELMTGRSLDGDPGGTTVTTTLQRSEEGSAPRQPDPGSTPMPSPSPASATPSPTSSATPSDAATTDPTDEASQPPPAATPGAGPSPAPQPSSTPGSTPGSGATPGTPGGSTSPVTEPTPPSTGSTEVPLIP